jgi:predicted phage-related endonuclease
MGTIIDISASHKTAIGCSKIAQALGMSRWGTAFELWAQLTGRQPWPDLGNHLRVALGEPMEDVLRPFVAERLGGTLTRDRREYRHPDLPLVGHVDYRLSRDAEAVVELLGGPASKRPVADMKTSLGHGARHRFGEDGTDEVDADVLLQMQGYMLLTGAEVAFVAALVPGPDLKIYPIRADLELQHLIREGVMRFWNCVQTDTPPDPTTEADARQRWTRHTAGKVIEVDPATAALLRDFAAVKARLRAVEAEEKAIRDTLIPQLQDADSIIFNGASLATFRANKDSIRVNWEGLSTRLLDDVDEETRAAWLADFTETRPGPRVLRLARGLEANS